jgi:hypothetical protein
MRAGGPAYLSMTHPQCVAWFVLAHTPFLQPTPTLLYDQSLSEKNSSNYFTPNFEQLLARVEAICKTILLGFILKFSENNNKEASLSANLDR